MANNYDGVRGGGGGGGGGGDADAPPFLISDKLNGTYRVSVFDAAGLTVRDVKIGLEVQHGVPVSEAILIVDGNSMLDDVALQDFAGRTSWIVLVHRPPIRNDADATTGNDDATAGVEVLAAAEVAQGATTSRIATTSAAETAGGAAETAGGDGGINAPAATLGESDELVLPFFYLGHVKHLKVATAHSVRQVLEEQVAPAFKVERPERLGLYLECCLLARDSLVGESAELLRSAPLVPVVHDLVTTRVRDQSMPSDAFRTDCEVCMTTGVNSKLRPFCSLCGLGVVMDVKPSFIALRQCQTDFPWRSLESLTGNCQNPGCTGFDTIVDVYFNCVCSSFTDDGIACNAQLASYKGGRVEVLLNELYRNQYFVRAGAEAIAIAARAEPAATGGDGAVVGKEEL